MYFQCGNFVHADNLVDVSHSIRQNRNARGFTDYFTHVLSVSGELIPDSPTQATIRTAIEGLLNAYNTGASVGLSGLFHDDGTASSHVLNPTNSLSGVLVDAIDFPPDSGTGQYATARGFSITLRAVYPRQNLAYQDFREEIAVSGTGGPRTVLIETISGVPQRQVTAKRTIVTARQSGHAVGLKQYPPYPNPIWPAVEKVDRRQQGKGSPRNDGGTFVEWPITWSYEFESPAPLFGTPNRK